MFKRIILAALSISMLAVPMAQAQSRYDGPRTGQHYNHSKKPAYHAPRQRDAHRPAPPRWHSQRPAKAKQHWARGQRVSEWQRRQAVRDYHRHGLRRPAAGQQWIKVNNDYLLISLATGVILGLAAGR